MNAQADPVPEQESLVSPGRILVADDNAANVKLLEDLLRYHG